MKCHPVRRSPILFVALCGAGVTGSAGADIDLLLLPAAQTAPNHTVVEIDLVARSDDNTTQHFAALEAILQWDADYMDLIGVDDGDAGYPFLPNHFLPDPDGINADLHDGDALFIALAQPGAEAPAPPEGLLVTTLQFMTLAETEATELRFLPTMGDHGVTRVRRLDLTDVTGDISSTAIVTIVTCGTADSDADGDVDLVDFMAFQRCHTGTGNEAEPLCQCLFDYEPDDDVDLADFVQFMSQFTGPLP